jgi:hypothetical protein
MTNRGHLNRQNTKHFTFLYPNPNCCSSLVPMTSEDDLTALLTLG